MLALSEHVQQFQLRVVQGALTTATAAFWRRRAADFDQARPRDSDYTGNATRDDLAALDQRCAAAARACRHHALLVESGYPELISPEVRTALAKAA